MTSGPDIVAAELSAQGYRVISNRHNLLARIDVPNWLEIMGQSLSRPVADFVAPNGDLGSWADHYRRCLSKDQVTVPESVRKLVKNSGFDDVGYVWKPGDPPELKRQMRYDVNSGALLSSVPIDGITQKLSQAMERSYGGPYFVGETLSVNAARRIALLMGFEFIGHSEFGS